MKKDRQSGLVSPSIWKLMVVSLGWHFVGHFSSLHALPFEKSQLGIVRDIYMDTTVPSEKKKL